MGVTGTPSHRIAAATVTLLDEAGLAMADQLVQIRQLRHALTFGCTGFEAIPLANGELMGEDRTRVAALYDRWLELFNVATLPFYWAGFEPRRGAPDTGRLQAAARWFVDRDVAVKGHPLCWHTETAPWLLDLTTDEIAVAQVDRIRREAADFRGLIDTWDVINEVVIMPVFDRYDNGVTRLARRLGRVGIVELAFEAARAANPAATLLINDFDLSADYERLIEDCLDAGVTIDAIGMQSHMHQGYWGEERTLELVERYARFGLPLHWTENTLVSGALMPPDIVDLNDYQVEEWPTTPDGEARQADEVERHYRTLFGHPAVAAITWWGLPDGGWLNAPSGLVRLDGSVKPAYEALQRLIKGEWWLPPTDLRTDPAGVVRFNGFPGTYEVHASGRRAVVAVDAAGEAAIQATLSAATPSGAT
jgi:GH35 family endo-1,4-beta-xylanase